MTRTVISFQDRGHGMTTERRAMTFFMRRLFPTVFFGGSQASLRLP